MKTWLFRTHDEWQFEVLIGRLQVRVGSHQQAVWWHNRDRSDYRWLLNTGKRPRACRAVAEGFGGF